MRTNQQRSSFEMFALENHSDCHSYQDSQDKFGKQYTEKEIIKHLKCLVAKQEQKINSLIHQVQDLQSKLKIFNLNKGQFQNENYVSTVLKFENLSPNTLKENGTNRSKDISNRSKNSSQKQRQNKNNEKIKQKLKELSNILATKWNKFYINDKNTDENVKKQGFSSLIMIRTIEKTCHLLNNLQKQINQVHKSQNNNKQKLQKQEKMLTNLMEQYEKSILKSQEMQKKLINEIKRQRLQSK